MLALGGITAVMGVLYALMQRDLKRVLAYRRSRISGSSSRPRPRAGVQGRRHGAAAAALALTAGTVSCLQSFAVQEPAVLRRRQRAQRDRHARHGAARRADPPHAADRLRVPGRLRGDFGAAAAQRLRLRMADLPGHPAQPAIAVMGPQADGARRRRACWRFRRRSRPPVSCAPSASRFSADRATPAASGAQETDGHSLAAMFVLAALCLIAGILPGLFIDALAPVVQLLVARPHAGSDRRRMAVDRADRRKPQLL